MSSYPKPWKVRYWQRCEEWHPKSMPYIVDKDDRLICRMPQTVCHPGMYDELADNTAKEIVKAVNGTHEAIHGFFNRLINATDKELAS